MSVNDQEEQEIVEFIELLGMNLKVVREVLPSSPSSEWRPVHHFLAKSIEREHPDRRDADLEASHYIACWLAAGFTGSSLRDRIASNDLQLTQKKVAEDQPGKDLRSKLKSIEAHCPKGLSTCLPGGPVPGAL